MRAPRTSALLLLAGLALAALCCLGYERAYDRGYADGTADACGSCVGAP